MLKLFNVRNENIKQGQFYKRSAQATIRALPRMSWERAEASSSSQVKVYDDGHYDHLDKKKILMIMRIL